MPELRRDPIIERWVIIATERGTRPSDFKHPAAVDSEAIPASQKCPFCPGNESATPSEILAYCDTERKKNASGWTLRVVPNKYPALSMQKTTFEKTFYSPAKLKAGQKTTFEKTFYSPAKLKAGQKTIDVQSNGMYDCMNGMGAHEVIIETPSHTEQFDEMDLKRVEDVIRAYKERIIAIKKDPHIRYIMVFKNHGRAAGATLAHPHSQLIAMPIVPILVRQEMAGARTYYDSRKRCVFCDIICLEKLKRQRIVGENDSFLALEPYASRFPFETWIVPKTHSGHFEEIRANEVKDLARIMKSTLGKIRHFLKNPPFNFIIHAAPVHEPGIVYYHWHIEIMPKLSQIAGFEWGTGFYINTTSPESAAGLLNGKS